MQHNWSQQSREEDKHYFSKFYLIGCRCTPCGDTISVVLMVVVLFLGWIPVLPSISLRASVLCVRWNEWWIDFDWKIIYKCVLGNDDKLLITWRDRANYPSPVEVIIFENVAVRSNRIHCHTNHCHHHPHVKPVSQFNYVACPANVLSPRRILFLRFCDISVFGNSYQAVGFPVQGKLTS
jgi:hypothetical protein